MNTKGLYILLISLFAFSSQVYSQKFGHINSSLLLLEMSEVKAADAALEEYQKTLVSAGEELVKSFQSSYDAYVKEANGGTLSAIQMKKREENLQAENQNIQNYELQVQQLLAKKKEELYTPILDKVRVALKVIGKEKGYTMIFDTSSGMLLHAVESEDVMALVKTHLGVQ
jgi:outer membrane protein